MNNVWFYNNIFSDDVIKSIEVIIKYMQQISSPEYIKDIKCETFLQNALYKLKIEKRKLKQKQLTLFDYLNKSNNK